MKDRHLWKLRQVLTGIPERQYRPKIFIPDETMVQVNSILKAAGISGKETVVSVAPGARNCTKQWTKEGFERVCRSLAEELGVKVVLIGDQQDTKISSFIIERLPSGAIDLCGKTTLKQLAGILKRSSLLVTNDSAPMHIAWALETPVAAIFGPTNPDKYGPTGPRDAVIRKELACSPCQMSLCRLNNECMDQISSDEVFQAAKKILEYRQ